MPSTPVTKTVLIEALTYVVLLLFPDVQDLTAKLKLMESGGDAPAEPVVTTDHHLYCNIHLGKEALLGEFTLSSLKLPFFKLYIQNKRLCMRCLYQGVCLLTTFYFLLKI